VKVRFVYSSRLLRLISPKWVSAMTLYPYILFRRDKDSVAERTRLHELAHIEQIQRMGVLTFYVKYVWYWLRYGYKRSPLEEEARSTAERLDGTGT
jgi:hypothetical protein